MGGKPKFGLVDDEFRHSLGIGKNICIQKPQDSIAFCLEKCSSFSIVLSLLYVLAAIQLND